MKDEPAADLPDTLSRWGSVVDRGVASPTLAHSALDMILKTDNDLGLVLSPGPTAFPMIGTNVSMLYTSLCLRGWSHTSEMRWK